MKRIIAMTLLPVFFMILVFITIEKKSQSFYIMGTIRGINEFAIIPRLWVWDLDKDEPIALSAEIVAFGKNQSYLVISTYKGKRIQLIELMSIKRTHDGGDR